MPLDLLGLHKQRHRWAMGIARVLISTLRRWRSDLTGTWSLGGLRAVLIVSQLSSRLNLGALAALCLLAEPFQQVLLPEPDRLVTDGAILLGTTTLALILASVAIPLATHLTATATFPMRLQAIASRTAMLPVSAGATLVGLMSGRQAFAVTPKQAPSANDGFYTRILQPATG